MCNTDQALQNGGENEKECHEHDSEVVGQPGRQRSIRRHAGRAVPSCRLRQARLGVGPRTPGTCNGGGPCQLRARRHTTGPRASCPKGTETPGEKRAPTPQGPHGCLPGGFHHVELLPRWKSVFVLYINATSSVCILSWKILNIYLSRRNDLTAPLLSHLLPSRMFEADPCSRPWKCVFLKARELFLECMTHMKRCSMSLIIWDMQIEAAERCPLAPVGMAVIRHQAL